MYINFGQGRKERKIHIKIKGPTIIWSGTILIICLEVEDYAAITYSDPILMQCQSTFELLYSSLLIISKSELSCMFLQVHGPCW